MFCGNVIIYLLNGLAIGAVVLLVGDVLLFRAFYLYAISKERSPAWCLLALVPVIGLIALPYLEEGKERNRRLMMEAERLRKKNELLLQDDDSDPLDDLRNRAKLYERAIHQLDNAVPLTVETLIDAARIADLGMPESFIRMMWSETPFKEDLRKMMRLKLDEGRRAFSSL